MKIYLLRYMDVMTGYTGYMKVRADNKEKAIQHLEEKYEDYEVVMD